MGKDISINIKSEITMNTTSVSKSANWRNQVPHLGLHHFNPPSLDRKLTSKRKSWEEHKSAPRDKGDVDSSTSSGNNGPYFSCFQFLMPSMYPKGSLYSSSMG